MYLSSPSAFVVYVNMLDPGLIFGMSLAHLLNISCVYRFFLYPFPVELLYTNGNCRLT